MTTFTCTVPQHAAAACNLEHVFEGHTVLEYLTGEVPRTSRDMVTGTDIQTISTGVNSEFVNELKHLLSQTNTLVQIARDDDSRLNALMRDANTGRQYSTYSTQFTLKPGDRVPYDSAEYTLLDITKTTPTGPAKAKLRLTTHDDVTEKEVLYSELRPLTAPWPQLFTW